MTVWRIHTHPHNNLVSLAAYHVRVIEEKLESGTEDAIALDCMSAVIALAFSVEAILNFVGHRKLRTEWDERAPYYKKVKALEAALGFEYKKTDQPFQTLEHLKAARDSMAHGKPVLITLQTDDDRKLAQAMQAPWASATKPNLVLEAYKDVTAFRNLLFSKARIKPGTSMSGAMGHG
jgi:hypothetical protein